MTLPQIVPTRPFADQRPGTSGLRKKVPVFQQPHYVENFVQSIFDALDGFTGADAGASAATAATTTARSIQIDPRAWPRPTASAGSWSARAASCRRRRPRCVIRKHKAFGGIILSASHNPGGPDDDFGIKYNIGNGGPAPEKITDAIFAAAPRRSTATGSLDAPDVDLDRIGTSRRSASMTVEVIDPVADYADADGDAVRLRRDPRAASRGGFRMRFDAMHAVTGPYATEILEGGSARPRARVVNGTPLPDFGGHHPDPNLVHAKDLYDVMMSRPTRRISARPPTATATAT